MTKRTREPPLKVELPFDEAIARALSVAPPKNGWPEHAPKPKRARKKPAPKTR